MSANETALQTETPPETAEVIASHFSESLRKAERKDTPYNHWLLDDMLPSQTIEAIAALPVPEPEKMLFYGRREVNNAARVYFTPENQQAFDVCRQMVDAFKSPGLIKAVEKSTGAPISQGRLRIEYCQDTDGFWLEPHVDISVKLFTMLIYLSDDPALYDAGTDIYDDTPEHNRVATAPYERNKGLIFIPGKNTWHGFSKRPINGVRKSLIINYVTPDWRDTWELA